MINTLMKKVKTILAKNNVVNQNSVNVIKSEKNKVNLNAWIIPNGVSQNIGDYLSKVIVEEVAKLNGIDINKTVIKTKHLYSIGSILMGYQDATIWGSGFGFDFTSRRYFKFNSFLHRIYHKTDIRAVRGPETKRILEKMGINCPSVFGDPAVLIPLFYQPASDRQTDAIIIPHYSVFKEFSNKYDNVLDTFTKDYKKTIDRICSADLVISSSLHGIIIAEAYGIPAVMLSSTPSADITKYKDWYYSTGRTDFVIADCVEEALNLKVEPLDKNIIVDMQNNLLESFPKDLWEI